MTARAPVRVVSLVPSVTETLLTWGVTPVGVTRFCEQPDLRAVGGTKDPDVAAIIGLSPDLVVCCPEENRREDAEALRAAGVEVLALEVDDVAGVGPALAGACGIEVQEPDRAAPTPSDPVVPAATAVVPVWRRPYVVLGPRCYGASVLANLGLRVVAPDAQQRYPEASFESLIALDADLVVAPSEPYPFAERHREELATIAPVVFVDGQDLFWWGVRTPSAMARLGRHLREVLG